MDLSYVFVIFLIIIVAEIVLSGTWNKYYFLYGIPLFSKEIEISNLDRATKEIQNFITNIDTNAEFSKYKGVIFDEHTFAFRKKLNIINFSRNDFERIHGTISINPENRNITIKGYMEYSFLAFMLYFLVFFISDSKKLVISSLPFLFAFLLSGLMAYIFDRKKYNKLVTEITELVNK
jgi:hypothetical protein